MSSKRKPEDDETVDQDLVVDQELVDEPAAPADENVVELELVSLSVWKHAEETGRLVFHGPSGVECVVTDDVEFVAREDWQHAFLSTCPHVVRIDADEGGGV